MSAANTYSYVFRKAVANGRAASRPWRIRREPGTLWIREPYLGDVAPPISVRKANFAQWVKRVTDHAKQRHGLSVEAIAAKAGIGDQTIYRWINGDGKKLPEAESVLQFCDALDIDPAEAFAILWPGKNAKAAEPAPFVGDPNYEKLQRKLMDPAVSDFDKAFIRETLAQLASRPTTPAKVIKRTGRTGGVKN